MKAVLVSVMWPASMGVRQQDDCANIVRDDLNNLGLSMGLAIEQTEVDYLANSHVARHTVVVVLQVEASKGMTVGDFGRARP